MLEASRWEWMRGATMRRQNRRATWEEVGVDEGGDNEEAK